VSVRAAFHRTRPTDQEDLTMLKRILIAAAVTALLVPGAAAAKSRTLHYKGKTKEGTKISFILAKGWLDRFKTSLVTTCVSAQGGTPHIEFTDWSIPFKYKLGYSAKVKYGDPTRHYKIVTHRRAGKRIVGKLSVNFSRLRMDSWNGYYLDHCLGTANFSLKPRR
jgi:hypothetical protein